MGIHPTAIVASGAELGEDVEIGPYCMIGPRVRGSVIGGLELQGIEFQAQPIYAQTGQGGTGGDIAFADTLGAFGKTLGAALGVNTSVLDSQITQGKVVTAALSMS